MTTSIPSTWKLRWEITVTLVIKFVVIYLLWLLFFSAPVDEHLTGSHVGDFLFGDVSESAPDNSYPSLISTPAIKNKEN